MRQKNFNWMFVDTRSKIKYLSLYLKPWRSADQGPVVAYPIILGCGEPPKNGTL